MAQRGRKSKPKIVRDPINLEPPKWLGPEGKAFFVELVKRLNMMGMAEQTDDLHLAVICEAYEDARKALREIEKDGSVIASKRTGMMRPHPAVARKNEAMRRLAEGLDRFGLNPRSRRRMRTGELARPEKSGFARFLPDDLKSLKVVGNGS